MKSIILFVLVSLALIYCLPHPDCLKNSQSLNSSDSKVLYPWPDNRVHRAGVLWLNVTNYGFMGNPLGFEDQCTGKVASGGEMPGDSGIDYLFLSGLQFGGYLDSAVIDIKGIPSKIFQGPLVSTAAEGSYMIEEILPYYFDDDPSGLTLGRIYETSNVEGRINCLFDDVYDPKATAYEQFTARFTDKGTTHSGIDPFDKREHIPLGIEVKQSSYAWPYEYAKKFIIVDYTIYNRNSQGNDIYDFFMGIYVDSDVKNSKESEWGHMDDLSGYKHKWDGYFDPATGKQKTVNLNLIWTADNDGREYITDGSDYSIQSEPGAGSLLDGATGNFAIRVLRNPNPNLRYSYNVYSSGWADEVKDWGPRWEEGLHSDWEFDLTSAQKGYDDTNYDSLYWDDNPFYPMYAGRTEGVPAGDKGHYMVMSNSEFDYDVTDVREVYLGVYKDPEYMQGTFYAQADKWRPWVITGTEEPGQISDGPIEALNDIANGCDSKYELSFGPLGNEAYENVAVYKDGDSLSNNKKVWKFAYGDSLKLTLAYIASENFNTSLEQDPNYFDNTVIDLSDGLDKSLYDQGWYDALYNVTWAERLYDVPMYDTPQTRYGATKKDGWYGEDVGIDGIFGDFTSDTYCWWLETNYSGQDEGENDFELNSFTEHIVDIYGNTATCEDDLLPFGRQHESDGYGITGSPDNGEGFGYMVKYDKLNGSVPQGSWVRYGYGNGQLDVGDGVPDFKCPPPPPSPKIKVTEIDNDVIVEWCSHEFISDEEGNLGLTGSEFTYDPFTRMYDFEGYEIAISPDRRVENYATLFCVDKVNYSYQDVGDVNYFLDNPIPADTLMAHPEDYPAMMTVNNKIYRLVPYGDNNDLTRNYEKDDLYSYSCITATSPYPQWGDIRYYKFTLHNQTLAEMKYIAVTAKDFGAAKLGVPPMKSSPESNATATVTSNLTTTDDVIVVPNPYRCDVKYTEMGWENTDGNYTYAEEYRKIAFLNIPERCVIRIYTLAGDLCKVIAHNGNSDSDVPYWYGKNGAYWNLINDNRQAVMSGIYLFSVQDVDKKKDDFVGKFVIIK